MLKLLTEEKGRISCLARGAMKSKQRFPGGIDLWDSGYFEFEPLKSRSILSLDSISDRERWPKLRESLSRFALAGFLTELLLRFTEEDHEEDGALCRPFLKTLGSLSREERGKEQSAAAAYFTAYLLKNLGYDICENAAELGQRPELAQWFSDMLEQNRPILPFDSSILFEGFSRLANYCETILSHELKSKGTAIEAVQRAVRTTT